MPPNRSRPLITSKEILSETGISRATLNNYIKSGILPAPMVRPPEMPFGGAKRIGYFPRAVLDRIEAVRSLKKGGKSMEEIVNYFKKIPLDDSTRSPSDKPADKPSDKTVSAGQEVHEPPYTSNGLSPRVTLEGAPSPIYLLDSEFQIIWINRCAENDLFHQEVRSVMRGRRVSVFELLFNWKFHEQVENWRDLIALHLSFVKRIHKPGWIETLHEGISNNEILLLKGIYENVSPFADQPVRKTHFQFFSRKAVSKAYDIYTLSCVEGLLFLFLPIIEERKAYGNPCVE